MLADELDFVTRARLLRRLRAVRPQRHQDAELRGTLIALRALARRVQTLTAEERELKREIQALVTQLAPPLLDESGIGPVAAAQVLLSWSHRGRFRSDAAFARLAGAAPIPASSGLVLRHRLDPGGDRQLNRALHTIVVSRRKHHPATIAYVARRRAEGKSVRDTIRCIKRYLARHLFRMLEAGPMAA
ncbi:MAG: transposase [Gaiellales bacterium]